ncbi:MAG: response regulator transcription factor [Burkholderiales bacterium]
MTDEPAPSLLIADDDPTFCQVLGRALERRGFTVMIAHDVQSALVSAQRNPPQYAVIDLKMPGPSGLELVTALRTLDEAMRIVVLTGYASIATAVEAIKLGATHYLAKPANADEIVAALQAEPAAANANDTDFQPLSVARLEWEHIQKVLAEHDGNISATARALNMHRRTLQRKLAKRPVRK